MELTFLTFVIRCLRISSIRMTCAGEIMNSMSSISLTVVKLSDQSSLKEEGLVLAPSLQSPVEKSEWRNYGCLKSNEKLLGWHLGQNAGSERKWGKDRKLPGLSPATSSFRVLPLPLSAAYTKPAV